MRSLALKHTARWFVIALTLGLAAATANAQTSQKKSPAAGKKATAVALTKQEVLEAEQLLSNLGYWTGPVDGRFDAASRYALVAFQKVEGRERTGRLTTAELQALRTASRPTPKETGYAHVEADLGRQVLFIVDESGTVSRVLPISSGNGEEFTSEGWTRRAVTPTGRFKIYRKVEGWRKAPLGSIYYPNYFLSGVAIHGSASVPAKPASHGCIRIPVYAAKEFSEMIPTGTVVLVHDDAGLAQANHSTTKAQ
jgi:cell wall hydrolase